MKLSKEKVGTMEITLSSVIRGLSQGTFPKIIESSSVTISLFRTIIPATFIYFYTLLKKERIKGIFDKSKIVFHGVSLLITLRIILFLSAYQLGSISIGTLIFFASTVYISMFESKVMGISFSFRNFVLSLASFGVIVLLIAERGLDFSLADSEFLGYLLMFVASILVVFENFIKKKLVNRLNNSEWVFYNGFAGSILMLPVLFIFPLPDLYNFSLILLFALLVGVIAYLLDVSALRKLRLTAHRLVGYVEPVVAIMVGIIFFAEPTSPLFFAAAIVVFGSIWFSKKT